MTLKIGPYTLPNNLVVAPMAGVTDRPFRQMCKRLGAGMAVSEMVAANPVLWGTDKHRFRSDHEGEVEPRVIQIAGWAPDMMAEAARYNVARGAQIIDINMGCPAKKVCKRAAGSALLADEALVNEILKATAAAVDVPVTLKYRTGPHRGNRNALTIARMAEDAGIAALAIHGRTRADAYKGEAEYDTIAAVKQAVEIPVMANGDIDSPQKAKQVLVHTQADGLMIGRAAQGSPWIYGQIAHYLQTAKCLPEPANEFQYQVLTEHLNNLYAFYGEQRAVKTTRKHVAWYLDARGASVAWRQKILRAETAADQKAFLSAYFEQSELAEAA